jgi:hypothetical protein
VADYDPMLIAEQILFPFPDRPTAWREGRMRGEELRTLAAMLLGDDADQIVMSLLGRTERVVEKMWEPYFLVPRYLAIAIARVCHVIELINQLALYDAEALEPPELWPLYERICCYAAQPANLMSGCREEVLYGEVGNALVKRTLVRAKVQSYDTELFRSIFGQLETAA